MESTEPAAPPAIRRSTLEDAPRIAQVRAAIRAEGRAFLSEDADLDTCVRDERDRLDALLERPACLSLVLLTGTELVGWLAFESNQAARTSHWGWLEIGLLGHARRRGLGALLLRELISWSEGVPALECIRVDCSGANPDAIRFFASHQFREEGRSHGAIQLAPGEYADIVRMSRRLK